MRKQEWGDSFPQDNTLESWKFNHFSKFSGSIPSLSPPHSSPTKASSVLTTLPQAREFGDANHIRLRRPQIQGRAVRLRGDSNHGSYGCVHRELPFPGSTGTACAVLRSRAPSPLTRLVCPRVPSPYGYSAVLGRGYTTLRDDPTGIRVHPLCLPTVPAL